MTEEENNGWIQIKPEDSEISIIKHHLHKEPKEAIPQSTQAAAPPPATTTPNEQPQEDVVQLLDKFIAGLENESPTTKQALIDQLIQLIMQMGSDLNHLGTGGIDQRKFANINELQQMGLAHFNYRGKVDQIRYWQELTDWVLNSSVSVGGLGRRQTIEITAAASGSAPGQFAAKPNILVRGLDRLRGRNWRDEAEAKGQIPVE